MTQTLGGKASGTSASGTTCVSGAFDVAPAVGKKILVHVGWFDDTPRTVTVTDNASGGSNTYAACGAKVAGGGATDAVQIFEAVVDRIPTAVTVTFSGDAGASRISCIWIDGNPGTTELYHGQLQAPGITTTDGTTTGSLGTPSLAGAFIFAGSRSSSAPDNFAHGTGFTTVHDLNVSNRTFTEYLVQGAAAPVAGTFTQDFPNYTQTVGVVVLPATPATSAAVTGTGASGAVGNDVRAGGKTLILTLTGDTSLAIDDTIRAAIRSGIVAASSPTWGWNNRIATIIPLANIVRTSSTVFTITLAADPGYQSDADEVLTITIPASALTGGVAIVATPTVTISKTSTDLSPVDDYTMTGSATRTRP